MSFSLHSANIWSRPPAARQRGRAKTQCVERANALPPRRAGPRRGLDSFSHSQVKNYPAVGCREAMVSGLPLRFPESRLESKAV